MQLNELLCFSKIMATLGHAMNVFCRWNEPYNRLLNFSALYLYNSVCEIVHNFGSISKKLLQNMRIKVLKLHQYPSNLKRKNKMNILSNCILV